MNSLDCLCSFVCPIRIACECDEHQDKHSTLTYSAKLLKELMSECVCCRRVCFLPVIMIIPRPNFTICLFILALFSKIIRNCLCFILKSNVYCPFVVSIFCVVSWTAGLPVCATIWPLGIKKMGCDLELCKEGNNGFRAWQNIFNYARNLLGMKYILICQNKKICKYLYAVQ